MFRTQYVRNGRNQIIGTKTSNSTNGETIARDREGTILGHSNSVFGNTRDAQGRLVSQSDADADLLFSR